ncbi:MAG: GSCFA domain-containing protein [Melioribacteraceae bacterium]|nr:GSCFA domain-containing protein [Melioribacteraceae bacterium]
MKLRTEINPHKSEFPIEHNEKILTIGSCFADNIAEYFRQYKFSILQNPFGVLYNPVSILNSLQILADEKKFSGSDLVQNQGEWHSFYHHSDYSHHDKEECLKKINEKVYEAIQFLKSIDHIIITYGTSFVYKHIEKNIIVSNCHKIPQSHFERILLSPDEIYYAAGNTVDLLSRINPDVKIVFTVSPIRHWKDGAVENQLSKAQLIVAVNKIVKNYKNCEYFSSYEIMMDDLRDYRFYKEDLLHPNTIAVEYIWQKFMESFLSDRCLEIVGKLQKLNNAVNHRIRNPLSAKSMEFAENNLNYIERLKAEYSYLDLSKEEFYFNSMNKI